jgi:hypothetical protein
MLRKRDFAVLGVLFTLLFGLLTGCAPSAPAPALAPPQVEISVSPSVQIGVGEEASIVTSTHDEISSYEWSAAKGALSSSSTSSVIYTAPPQPGQDIVTLVVKGPGGATTRSVSLTIIDRRPTQVEPTKAVEAIIPPTSGGADPTLTPDTVECEGNSTAEYAAQGWAAFNGKNYQKILACAQGGISRWTAEADTQQANRLRLNLCKSPPDPKDEAAKNAFWGEAWALNDIGVLWFLRGEAYYGLQDWPKAREAYQTVIDDYSCAYAWDPRGWFWEVEKAARERLDAIQNK